MKAIILSGGQGLRLRPLTDDKPKPLIPVNGRPISEHQIEWLTKNISIEQVIFACGYRWEKLKEHFGSRFNGISIEYSVEETPLGTGGAVRQAILNFGLEEEVIVMNGDIITDLSLKHMLNLHTMNGTPTAVTMLLVPFRSRFGIVQIDKLRFVRSFVEKPVFPDQWINGGIYIINPKKILKHLPEKGSIEDITFPKLIPYGELMAHPHYGEWDVIDSMKDLQELEARLRIQQTNAV